MEANDGEVQVEEVLVETVKSVRATLQMVDETKADDAEEIVSYIKEDANHIAIRHDVDEEQIESALEVVIREEIAPYTPPEDLITLEEILGRGKPLLNLAKCLDPSRQYVGIHHAPGGIGSTGSFILASTDEGEAPGGDHELAVLKQLTMQSPAEVFASLVMRKMGLRSPMFITLTPDETKALVDEKLRFARVTSVGPTSALFEEAFLSPGALLMEFEPGKTLLDATDRDFDALRKSHILQGIGKCMSVDMVLNCVDRIPIVWDNDGNPSNIMIAEDNLSVIDSSYNRVKDEEASAGKVERVHACVRELKSGQLGEHAERVRDFFKNSTNGKVVLTEEELHIIMDAARDACQQLAKDHQRIFDEVANETRCIFAKIVSDSGITTKESLEECLDLSFCIMCAEAML